MALSGIRINRMVSRTPHKTGAGEKLDSFIKGHLGKTTTAEEPEDTLKMRESYFADRNVLGNAIPPMEEASAGLQIIKPQRKSILASDFVVSDEEDKDKQGVLKKRRGSIFGNVNSSLFGN